MVSKGINVTYLSMSIFQSDVEINRDEYHGVKIPMLEEIIDFINGDAGLCSPSMTYQMLIQSEK